MVNLILIILCIFSVAYAVITFALTFRFFQQKEEYTGGDLPSVSILKPVKGVDHGAYENFKSYCKLDYPDYELIFCLESERDPVFPLLEKLKTEFSNVRIEIVVSNTRIGPHPKVNNLYNGYQRATHEVIVYNDSDTRVTPNYLKAIVPPLLKPEIGAVTCIPVYRDSNNWVAGLETIGINADTVPSFSLTHLMNQVDYCVGGTIALRRKTLDEVGGFKAVTHNICDDGLMGKLIKQKGYRIHLSHYLISCIHHDGTFKEFYRHQLRWFATIRAFAPLKYFMCLFCFGTFYAFLLWCFNIDSMFASFFLKWIIAVRIIIALCVNVFFIKDKSSIKYVWLLPFRDLIFALIWLHALVTFKVSWRGQTFRISYNGTLRKA